MKGTFLALLRDLSSILAGFKLAIIVISYFGVGSLAKWVIEEWYPFTRWLWDNIFTYFSFPEISDIEKDGLTVMAFFLPLGITSLIYRIRKIDEDTSPNIRIISASLGVLFVYIMCENIIQFILENAKMNEYLVAIFEKYYAEEFSTVLVVLAVNFLVCIFFVLDKKEWVERLQQRPQDVVPLERMFIAMLTLNVRYMTAYHRMFVGANRVFMLVGIAIYILIGAMISVSLDSYLPLVAVIFVGISVIVSVSYAPKKLMLAAGASLAFISAAYMYELFELARDFIENSTN